MLLLLRLRPERSRDSRRETGHATREGEAEGRRAALAPGGLESGEGRSSTLHAITLACAEEEAVTIAQMSVEKKKKFSLARREQKEDQ
jgi:hypothetical protein